MRALGVALLLALAYLVFYKLRIGEAAELLWICYPSAAILCAGLLFNRPMLASVGGLFYLAVGLPYWLIGLVVTGTTSLASLAVHAIAPLAGVLHLRRGGVPRSAKYWVIPLYLLLSALSRAFTGPDRNVNLVWGPYFPIAVPGWANWGYNCIIGFLLLISVEWIVNRSSGRSATPERR